MSVTIKDPLDPHDVTDFRFQGLRKVRLSGSLSLTSSTMSLVTTVPNTGIVLVVGDSCVHVVKTVDIEKQDQCSKAERGIENSQLNKVTVDLPGEVLSVGVSCDGLTTSVVVKVGQFPTCLLFDTRGLVSSQPDLPLSSTSLNTTSSSVVMTGLHWNPALPDMFCVTWEDGSLALYTVKVDGSTECLTLPPAAGVVAMAWSPKGKQLVVVKKNQTLVQYKPDLSVAKYPTLKEMKTTPGPGQAGLVPVSIAWLSTYEFLVGLRDQGDSEARPGLWLVKGSKEGNVDHTPYDDICYSTGEGVGMVFTSHTLQEWGVVVVGSSASIELGVLGTDAGAYTQWILEDNARAEIPLDSSNDECYPVGLAVDYTSTVGTPVGETTGPPSPLLYLLSSDGLLCPFYCVNTNQGVTPLCKLPVQLPAGKRTGTVPLPPPAKQSIQPTTTTILPKPAANLTNIFNQSANSSFAQSTPLKPLPTSTPLFQPPAATKDPTPPLPALSKVAKEPTPPFSAFSKDPTPPFNKLAKDPTPPFGKLPMDPAPPFGKLAKDPTSPFSMPSIDPTPPISKGSTPSYSKGPSPPFDSKLVTPKETTPLSDSTSAKVSAAIDEEYEAFEAELKELRTALSSMNTFVGTQQDKIELCTRTEACSKFCRDVIDTTQCQNTEIFSLRSSTLETFSWLEEARARDSSTGDTKYLQLLRARPLDPRSLRKMEDLRAQFFYCEQQVEEAGNALDSQWEEHVGKLKRTVRSDQHSVREELSQAVMTNHKILERQSDVVDEISNKIKKMQAAYPITMGRPGRSPSKSRAESELDKLADSLREKSKLTPAKTVASASPPAAIVSTPSPVRVTNSTIVSPVKGLNPSTDQALRTMLDKRPLSITKAVRRESPTCKPTDKPSSAKLVEKLKDSATPAPPKIVASGSLAFSGLSSDKSAFHPVSTSKQGAFQSLPLQSPIFKSGSISVEVSASPASSKPVKAPVYEPISPASNSPEKNEEAIEAKKVGFSLLSMTAFGTSLSTKSTSASSSDISVLPKKATTAAVSDNLKVTSDTSSASKSLFGNLGSTAATSSIVGAGKTALSSAFSFGSSASMPSSATSSSFGSGSIFGGSFSAASSTNSSTGSVSSSTVASVTTTNISSVVGSKPVAASTASAAVDNSNSKPTGLLTAVSSVGLLATKAPGKLVGTVSGTSSVFGGSAATSLGSVFGTTSSSQTSVSSVLGAKTLTTSMVSAFGSSGSSAFGKSEISSTATAFSTGEKSSNSAFGATPSSVLSSGAASLGSVSVTSNVLTTLGGSSHSTSSVSVSDSSSQPTASTGSVFGSTTQPTSLGSVFGGSTQPVSSGGLTVGASSGSVFGESSQPVSSGSIFGATTTAASGSAFFGSKPAASGSIFGRESKPTSSIGATQPTSSSGSVFGGSSQPVSSSGSVFGGGTSQPASSSVSVFGGGTSQPVSSSGSVFGGTPQPASSGPVFGGVTSQPASSSGSVFGGGTTLPASSSGSVFGGTSQPASSSVSVFGGKPQPASSGSVFGGGTSQPTSSSGSVFSGTSQPASTSGSVFGGGTSIPASSSGSVFGGTSQPASSSGSVFGGSSQPASSGSVFGGGSSQPLASAGSVFGGTQKTVSSSGSVFGGASQPTSSGSVFGGSSQPGSSGSIFGGGNASGGGGFLGGLGGTASSDNSGKNPFGGATSSIGASSSGGLFGSTGSPSVFGGAPQTSTFGSASAFSSGANIASQGFGVQQNTPSKPAAGFGAAAAFGSPSTLGSPPAFGSPAGFGAAPAFGGASTFGGGASTFGSGAAAAPTFGAAANASTFGSMAGSSAPAFGSMASSASAFGSIASSAPAFGSSGDAFGGGAPTSPPPAGQQFNSWR